MTGPREEQQLPTDRDAVLRLWYDDFYSSVAVSAHGSLVQRYLHGSMEGHIAPSDNFPQVLEIGGNRGEHVPYVRHRYDRYVLSDLTLPDLSHLQVPDPRVEAAVADVESLPYDDAYFDRVISTCVLHHVSDPLVAFAQIRRVTRSGGNVTVLLPTDPGICYRVAKTLTSGRAARRRGILPLYRLVDALDHRNHFGSLVTQLRHVFRDDEIAINWRPFRVPSWNLNAFAVVQITVRKR